jgi:hypothetical protein
LKVDEGSKRLWDVVLGIVAPLLTVTGILIGVWQFNVGEQHRADLEFHRQLFIQRLDTYKAIATISGEIAATDDPATISRLAATFDAQYWGLTLLVEDAPVQDAMTAFHEELHDFLHDRKWTSNSRIKQKALTLAKACRASIEDRNEAKL